uniref:Elongation of very long chain fatty acids protein n=1 Tax=Timema monikensis TaxID=170555 RepID=A0A7R9EM69_9NEOP|nr:unnamed protein product [Timema monikensis]
MGARETEIWVAALRGEWCGFTQTKMAGLVRMAIDRYVNLVDSISDPRVNDWPLMDSPVPTLLMIGVYLYFVIILGPRVMANKKPFQLKTLLIAYNAAQVIFSLVMLWEVSLGDLHLMSGWLFDYSFKCQPVDYSHNPTALRVGFTAKDGELMLVVLHIQDDRVRRHGKNQRNTSGLVVRGAN